MSGANGALRAALVARLAADAPLTALIGADRVFSHVPDGQPSPYVQLRIDAKAWETSTEYGAEHTVELNAWTEGEGPKLADRILAAIEDSLREASITLSGHRLVNLRLQASTVFRDGEGQTYCGYQRWRAVTEEL